MGDGVGQCHTAPSEAEEEKSDSQERGDSMPDHGARMVRTEVETKPEGSKQSKQLAGQEVHLDWEWWEGGVQKNERMSLEWSNAPVNWGSS